MDRLAARTRGVSVGAAHASGLVDALAQVPDPRDPRGVIHPLPSLLAVAVAAVLAGARSVAAIGEWAADAPQPVLARLGVVRDRFTGAYRVPDTATIGRVLADLVTTGATTSEVAAFGLDRPAITEPDYAPHWLV